MNNIKVGDVIKNVKAVLISDSGWIYTDPMPAGYTADTTYPVGDYWIVESIGERSCALIHMSGRKAKLGDNTLQWSFRVE